jgi:hypothetical protein
VALRWRGGGATWWRPRVLAALGSGASSATPTRPAVLGAAALRRGDGAGGAGLLRREEGCAGKKALALGGIMRREGVLKVKVCGVEGGGGSAAPRALYRSLSTQWLCACAPITHRERGRCRRRRSTASGKRLRREEGLANTSTKSTCAPLN